VLDAYDPVPKHWTPIDKATREELRAGLRETPLAEPIKIREDDVEDKITTTWEVASYEPGTDPAIDRAISEIRALGGDLRSVRKKDASDKWIDELPNAYFRLDERARPILGIDLTQDFALAGLAHELEHLRMWNEWRKKFLQQGMSPEKASRAAFEKTSETALRVEGERRSVEAEMRIEADGSSPYNRGATFKPRRIFDRGYLNRIMYPEIVGVRDLLHRARWSGEPLDEAGALRYLDSMLRMAERFRANPERLLGTGETGPWLRSALGRMRHASHFDLLFSKKTLDAFKADDTIRELERLFEKAAAARLGAGCYWPVDAAKPEEKLLAGDDQQQQQ
jgi:hypothetical protein